MRPLQQSRKLAEVCYDIRGPVLLEAKRMEDEGHRILKLNIGNPAPFGFEAPEHILVDMKTQLAGAHGYSDSKGIVPARRAVVQYYQTRGVPSLDIEDVYLGNGVSELIVMALQALLDDGDEVLVPAPDYPLWTAAVSLAGGRPVHYLCDEAADWSPDLGDLRAKVTDRTKAVVIINPNNPTGAVYSADLLDELLDVARRHDLVVMADEIYDKILYDDAVHVCAASLAPDLLCLTFNGLSKSYRLAGFRSGWLAVSGPKEHASSYLEGLDILANMRLCANHPAQHAVATALGGRQSIDDLVLPGGRLRDQRDAAYELMNQIPGVTTTKPAGALYLFPRLDPRVYDVQDDEQLVLDLLRQEQLLVVQGTGFNWPRPDHLRLVTLPPVADLQDAIGRIERFLARYRLDRPIALSSPRAPAVVVHTDTGNGQPDSAASRADLARAERIPPVVVPTRHTAAF
ncbi:MAG TPA: pyridoxal phosphate-dependent aminotransferase [Dermatophilaceae bacterium]|nr:pyridoxal phosphate-dependent aminotransferase [Dermatophilaceae bacterium]